MPLGKFHELSAVVLRIVDPSQMSICCGQHPQAAIYRYEAEIWASASRQERSREALCSVNPRASLDARWAGRPDRVSSALRTDRWARHTRRTSGGGTRWPNRGWREPSGRSATGRQQRGHDLERGSFSNSCRLGTRGGSLKTALCVPKAGQNHAKDELWAGFVLSPNTQRGACRQPLRAEAPLS